jgi:benzodiazapine receptor
LTFDSEYRPFFRPPGWVVGPVWAVLYTCLALSISSVFSQRHELRHGAIIVALFCVQLGLNLAWPSVFNSERYLLSLGMLIAIIAMTTIYAYLVFPTDPFASKLVWPYIVWVGFAAAINAAYFLEAR